MKNIAAGFFWSFVIGALIAATTNAADSPTGRRTTDRRADLIESLAEAGMYEDAEAICLRYLSQSPHASDEAATWTIRLCSVRVAKLRSQANDDEAAWAVAVDPVREMLAMYSAEPYSFWLRLQELLASLARSEVRQMRSFSYRGDVAKFESAESLIRESIRGLRDLDNRLEAIIPTVATGRSEEAHLDDLVQLREIARRRIVDGLLIQAELYPADSDDALAIATEAERAAETLLETTPLDSENRETVVRLLSKARREAKNLRGAKDILEPWVRNNRIADPATLAQWVLIEMQLGNNDSARQTLLAYYGQQPSLAPRSVEMDLARLQFLIKELGTESSAPAGNNAARDAIAAWVEAIGVRGGPFARRAAETEMLRELRISPNSGNATLLVAKAGQLIRSGTIDDLKTAASLLSQAADAEAELGREDEAFKLATQAAAATARAGDLESAAKQFAATALRFPKQPQSAAFHFEAARTLANYIAMGESAGQTDIETITRLSEQIEIILLNQTKNWPAAEQTAAGRQWLIKIYEASERYDEAARISLHWPIVRDSEPQLWLERIELAGRLWRHAISVADAPQRRLEIGRSGTESFMTLVDADVLADSVRSAAINESNHLAALTLDRESLSTQNILTTGESSTQVVNKSTGEFANDLKLVRTASVDPLGLALEVPKTMDSARIIELAHLRLIEDGKADDKFRVIAGKAILRIAEGNPSSEPAREIAIATADAWTGNWQQTDKRLMILAADKRAEINGADILRQAADLLGGVDKLEAKQRSIEIWNRIAGGVKQGSPSWHEAKLAALEQMVDIGNDTEATKLAKYILLTQPSGEPKFQQRYQAVLNRSPK